MSTQREEQALSWTQQDRENKVTSGTWGSERNKSEWKASLRYQGEKFLFDIISKRELLWALEQGSDIMKDVLRRFLWQQC